jgi:hypothetical protein
MDIATSSGHSAVQRTTDEQAIGLAGHGTAKKCPGCTRLEAELAAAMDELVSATSLLARLTLPSHFIFIFISSSFFLFSLSSICFYMHGLVVHFGCLVIGRVAKQLLRLDWC